jgi:hypothetical protein
MGLPYSKQINAAFDQVTPLVAAGFEVLQTTKDIAISVAIIQVLTLLTLVLILVSLLGILCSVNDDLKHEREQLVTPAMRWLASWVFKYGRIAGWILRIAFFVGLFVMGWLVWHGLESGRNEPNKDGKDDDEEGEGNAKDNDAEDKKDEKDEKQ